MGVVTSGEPKNKMHRCIQGRACRCFGQVTSMTTAIWQCLMTLKWGGVQSQRWSGMIRNDDRRFSMGPLAQSFPDLQSILHSLPSKKVVKGTMESIKHIVVWTHLTTNKPQRKLTQLGTDEIPTLLQSCSTIRIATQCNRSTTAAAKWLMIGSFKLDSLSDLPRGTKPDVHDEVQVWAWKTNHFLFQWKSIILKITVSDWLKNGWLWRLSKACTPWCRRFCPKRSVAGHLTQLPYLATLKHIFRRRSQRKSKKQVSACTQIHVRTYIYVA